MPLVRCPSRGLSEDEPRAFMFTNVIDVKGRKYDIPVVVGTLAGVAENLWLLIATRKWDYPPVSSEERIYGARQAALGTSRVTKTQAAGPMGSVIISVYGPMG